MTDRFRPDIIISDRNGNPIAIVEVKASAAAHDARILDQLRHYIAATGDADTFAILADPDTIRIYRGEASNDSTPITIAASGILKRYDADYDSQVIYEPYLASLIEAWLNDLSIHWKSEHPPGEDLLPKELVTRLQAA